jgi:chitin-binding protein
MRLRRTAAVTATCLLPVLSPLLTMGTAAAHGSMEAPGSRVYTCYREGPENPRSAACKAAVATGGTQALYDWNGVRIGNAAGRHREIIPDGKLCSAGNDEFRGLDLARADWPAANLSSGADFTFRFKATAQHRGGFELYVTKNGYDPTRPLKWSDLEDQPFATVNQPSVQDGSYLLPAHLPAGKTGRHLIYAIWQRSDSPEAFYSCSDVVFGGQAVAPVAATKTSSAHDHSTAAPSSEVAPSPSAACGGSGAIGSGNGDTGSVMPAVHVGEPDTGGNGFWLVLLVSGAIITSGLGGLFLGRRQNTARRANHRLRR